MLWLAVALPLVVLMQIVLVTLRNAARRRIHAPVMSDHGADADDDLATIIGDALVAVVDRVPHLRDTDAILAAADATTRRVAARATLTVREERVLHRELQVALLEALGEPHTRADRLDPVDPRRIVVEDLP